MSITLDIALFKNPNHPDTATMAQPMMQVWGVVIGKSDQWQWWTQWLANLLVNDQKINNCAIQVLSRQ